MSMLALLLAFSLAQQATSSGLLTVRLKSAHAQKANIFFSDGTNPFYLVLPIVLPAEEESKFGQFIVDFKRNYTVTIRTDETPELGLNETEYVARISPIRGTMSPAKLNLPLTGIMLDFECDANWSGQKCDVFADAATSETEKTWKTDIEFAVDYTVNPSKLETIVAMLKKENEITNVFKSRETTAREEKIDVTPNLPPIAADKESEEASGELLH